MPMERNLARCCDTLDWVLGQLKHGYTPGTDVAQDQQACLMGQSLQDVSGMRRLLLELLQGMVCAGLVFHIR